MHNFIANFYRELKVDYNKLICLVLPSNVKFTMQNNNVISRNWYGINMNIPCSIHIFKNIYLCQIILLILKCECT